MSYNDRQEAIECKQLQILSQVKQICECSHAQIKQGCDLYTSTGNIFSGVTDKAMKY